MIKLRNYGYTLKTVELREITIAELKLHIINAYRTKGDKSVKLINIVSGTVTVFNNIDDVLENDYCGDCKIEIIGMPHSYGTSDDNETIILYQLTECDRIIK